MLFFKDRRDRGKNTIAVIWTQILALPAVPLCFFALRAFWPQQISVMLFPVILLAPVMLVMVPVHLFGRKRAWLVKEKLEILKQEMTVDSDPSRSKTQDRESRMAEIRRELAENRLNLKTANDHIDRGDAFWKLGDLYSELSKLDDAEESYDCAVNSYNDALQIDPDNRTAIANKFKMVEAVSELKRRRHS